MNLFSMASIQGVGGSYGVLADPERSVFHRTCAVNGPHGAQHPNRIPCDRVQNCLGHHDTFLEAIMVAANMADYETHMELDGDDGGDHMLIVVERCTATNRKGRCERVAGHDGPHYTEPDSDTVNILQHIR